MFSKKVEVMKFSVSEYVGFINDLTSAVPVLVEGEVSNFRDIPGRNFCYFDIKDENAVAKCFQGFWHSKKVSLENGATVRVFGYPTLQKNGSLVIDVKEVFLVGDGELQRQYQELKARLEKEGLFVVETKQQIPKFPLSVGLIAGKNSSAYHDVIAELAERWGGVEVFFYGAKVQGVNARKEIIEAISHFNRVQIVDVLIIARGGGSMEDLQAFDSEDVVREIFASKIPTISAIGHEDHWTLADFVADMRAKTPTKAAQIAVPSRDEIFERLDFFSLRVKGLIKNRLAEIKSDTNNLDNRLALNFRGKIGEIRQKVQFFKDKMGEVLVNNLRQKLSELENFEKMLEVLNPKSILSRGYCALQKNGKRITSIGEVNIGDEILIRLQNGEINSKIQGVKEL